MNGDVRPSVNKILNAIENGNLTKDEMIRRIEAIAQEEAEKPDAEIDFDLISACETLLEQLYLHKAAPLDDRLAANKEQVAKRIQRISTHRAVWKTGLRAVAVAAAVMVLLVAVDVVFDRGWFMNQSTVDEQQYVVQGQKVDPNVIEEGTAGETITLSEIITTSYEELVSFLECEPILPTWLPETLQLDDYRANRVSDEEVIMVQYVNRTSGEIVHYMQVWYNRIEDMRVSFEQIENGTVMMVDDIKVYQTNNINNTTYNWSINQTVFSLIGTLDNEDAIKIIQSTLGGKNNAY